MVLIGLLTLILSITFSSLRTNAIYYNRVTIIVLLYSATLAYTILCVEPLDSGVELFGGLFQVTTLTLSMDVFICLVGTLVLLLGDNFAGGWLHLPQISKGKEMP